MNGQQLKNSILQMAVQGKLVPQDPNDEPASVLIQRIREEKEKLIKEKKIKKEKTPSYIFRGSDNLHYEKIGAAAPKCIEDQLPFEIPDSWEWVRLNNIFSVINGDRGKNYPAKSTLSNKGIPFISAVNLDGKSVVNDDNLLCLSDAQYDKLGSGKLIKGDVVVCIRGSLGKHGKFPFYKGAIASSLVILRSMYNEQILSEFIMMYLDSPLFFDEIKKFDNGTAQPNLAAKSLEQFFVPLPPLSEQKRIVAKIEEILPHIDEYDTKASELIELNDSFPERFKKSILQEAVQGKLVPQDPSDEPASILLEKIAKEKEKLIKEGKIKKQKSLPPITEDEIPFDIPNSWEWVRLGNIATLTMGQSPKGTAVHEGGDGIEFHQGKICFTQKYLCKSSQKTNEPNKIVEPNTLLLCVRAPVGTVNITQRRICIGRGLCGINIHSGMDSDFMFYWLTCLKNDFIKKATGTTFIAITGNIIEEELIPLPPLEEQKRIVAKIEELMPLIDNFNKA